MTIKEKIKRVFCQHKSGDVIRWHYVHIPGTREPTWIEIELYCSKCNQLYYRYIKKLWTNEAKTFVHFYKDKDIYEIYKAYWKKIERECE